MIQKNKKKNKQKTKYKTLDETKIMKFYSVTELTMIHVSWTYFLWSSHLRNIPNYKKKKKKKKKDQKELLHQSKNKKINI